jgi:Glycosyl hydrolases related to GH101 family, GH129
MRKDKNSPYYRGRYWPPEMSEIAFKEIPMKEKHQHKNFDPRFKIPLWEAVYHDCLISTAHPSSPSLKYSNVKTDVALTEMFYQYPPVYNLNFDFFQDNKDRIVHHYKFYRSTHAKTINFPVTEFEFLTEDRLVQRIQFGDIQIVANFSLNSYQFKGDDVPGKSILYIDKNGNHSYFNPENF